MTQKSTLLERLQTADDSKASERVWAWLSEPATDFISSRIAKQTVSELLRLWRTRLRNVSITGFPLDGAASLIGELERFQPQHLVEQYALQGAQFQGTLFFLASTGEYLGAVIVPMREASRLAS